MFVGSFKYQLDDRGRFSLPSRLRKAGKGTEFVEFVATIGLDECIALFPASAFEDYLSHFDPSSISEDEEIAFYRTFLSKTVDVHLDNHGRILIPTELLAYAGIEKDVQIVGIGEWMEIWKPEKFAEYQQTHSEISISGTKHFFASIKRSRSRREEE